MYSFVEEITQIAISTFVKKINTEYVYFYLKLILIKFWVNNYRDYNYNYSTFDIPLYKDLGEREMRVIKYN